MNEVIDNLGPERFALQHLKSKPTYRNYEEDRSMFQEIMHNPLILEEIRQNIHIKGTVLEDLETASFHMEKGQWDHPLVQKVIQVGEFDNKNNSNIKENHTIYL